jgi:Glycosyltransferase family 87
MKRVTRLAGLTVACACLGNVLAEILRSLRDAYNTDFLSSFYTAASMLRHGDHAIYCSSCLQAHAQQLFHVGSPIFQFQYDNPPLGAWLLQPLTFVTPQTALAAFLLLTGIAVGAAGWLLCRNVSRDPRRLLIGVLAFASLPAAMTFAYGQWDGLLALAGTGAYVALQRDRQVLAGMLIAVLLLKPQLIWLVPIVVVIAGSWRLLCGIMIGALVFGLSSIAILGWTDTYQWVRQISPNIVARTGLSLPHMLVSFGATSSMVVASSAALAVIVTVALLIARSWLRSLTRQQQLSLGLLVSMLAAPHLLSYDLIIVAPVIVLWGREQERHALAVAIGFSVAFLIDTALPMSWSILEGLTLLGCAALYLYDLGSFSRTSTTTAPLESLSRSASGG